MPEKFDAIVVGAGPAGSTAALLLAQAGLKVALFERGEYPGAKNMFGGALYPGDLLGQLLPSFWEEAPVERYVTRRIITFLTPTSSLSMDFKDTSFGKPPYNGFTVLRAKFDQWYARKAEEAGAFLVPETVVDDLVWDRDRVIGVRARREEGEVYADVVIAADGVNSLLAQQAGLRKDLSPEGISVSAKEVLTLPAKTIEERFNLSGKEGVANEFLGSCTEGVHGGGFLYTNKTSLSLGVVAQVSSLAERKISVAELLEVFKSHPSLKELLKDAVLKEYSGHLIPGGGMGMVPQLYGNGIMVAGDAAGFVNSTGLTLEGMNFAIASGFAAAEAVKRAKERGDYSQRELAHYQTLLEESFVLRDLKTFRHAPSFLANPRLYELYPALACGVAERFFKVNGSPRRKLWGLLRDEMKGRTSLWELAKDGIKAGRALLWP